MLDHVWLYIRAVCAIWNKNICQVRLSTKQYLPLPSRLPRYFPRCPSASHSCLETWRVRKSALFEAILLPLIKEICLCTSQVYNLRAAVTVLLLHRALFAVEGIWDSHAAANHAAPLVWSVVALVANPYHSARAAHKCAGGQESRARRARRARRDGEQWANAQQGRRQRARNQSSQEEKASRCRENTLASSSVLITGRRAWAAATSVGYWACAKSTLSKEIARALRRADLTFSCIEQRICRYFLRQHCVSAYDVIQTLTTLGGIRAGIGIERAEHTGHTSRRWRTFRRTFRRGGR